ncbi:hypothetical protein ACLB2K_049615 [Fragaria x ananassa]
MAASSSACLEIFKKTSSRVKRRLCANISIILIPAFFCTLCALIQYGTETYYVKKSFDYCKKEKSPYEITSTFPLQCPIPSPIEWPPLLQVPKPYAHAVRSDIFPWTDLPDESCMKNENFGCPVTMLITGNNQTLAQGLGDNMFPAGGGFPNNSTNSITDWAKVVMEQCDNNEDSNINRNGTNLQVASKLTFETDIECLPYLILWRNSSSEINDELFKGDAGGNKKNKPNGILTALDISNSDENTFNVSIWYNSTVSNTDFLQSITTNPEVIKRVPRLVNRVSNAYLQFLTGAKTIQFDFVKEMPKGFTSDIPDLGAFIDPVLFTWVVLQLFPVVLANLVYEKQERLRVMMKMHGLGDGPYWMISYSYFLTIYMFYILCFVGFGSILGLNFFYRHDYSLQFIFYFFVINLQIALAFLLSSMFSHTRSATEGWIIFLELYPGFSLYRGLFEFMQYATDGKIMKTSGMRWGNLNDSVNGMKDVLAIMAIEWAVLSVLLLAFYIDQVVTWGKSPLFFSRRKKAPALQIPSMERLGSKGYGDMEKPDVAQEAILTGCLMYFLQKEKVDKLLEEAKYTSHVVICDNIKKVYPGRDGNPEKFAVRGLSLALPQGECFGMLGPSGAGKTSFIEMMIGLIKPTTGTAYVQGLDLVTQMKEIYACIGVCPQHDLLWATLTGREHLLFYGRLKNLKGSDLTKAVEDSLKNLNLFNGGVADKRAGQYSGGMKRRLSVAISLIGNPIAIYMDEPSTGLDPASRNTLWNVIKLAKQSPHSMEEAEFLCDRIGIFVDGRMQCLGNPKELKGRYGGSYVFTITTDSCHDQEVESLIHGLAPNAIRVYHLAGTQKFEFPKSDVRIADVFQTVEHVKKIFTVYAWGLADTTLEDVFIKVASAPKRLASNANDEKVGEIYELKKGNFSVKLTNYGATMLSVVLPDKNGKLDDVVLGFESLKDYTNDSVYFGATVGRVANRIGRAEFTLNGNHYKLVTNDHGKNTLHGGSKGFSDVLWTAKRHIEDSHITFTYDSRDGEEGFPGDLSVSVTYMFVGHDVLAIKMEAKALTKATPVNLAHHTYWNLRGHNSGDILSHKIHIFGSNITPVNDELIPTGDIAPVKGTAYDFLEPREIGSRINELPDGYDINYIMDPSSSEHLRKAAVLHDSVSGRKMELWTNQPGLQFYTSNMLNDVKGKGGFVYKKYAAVCLETQGFPDSVNHPNFPSQILNPGDTYMHSMVYRFTAN